MKILINKRQKEAGKETTYITKCRLCKHSTKDVNHIISSCPEMFVRHYLPIFCENSFKGSTFEN